MLDHEQMKIQLSDITLDLDILEIKNAHNKDQNSSEGIHSTSSEANESTDSDLEVP